VLQETVHPVDPEGWLDAMRPLMLLVLGTAQMPPPFSTTMLAGQLAVALVAVVALVTN
jgi:hypothetical protein